MKASAGVVIVGGGVIGLSLARELKARGEDVAVIERGRTGQEASSAAAGLLSAQSDALAPSAFFDLALESRDLYPEWVSALRGETGLDTGYRRTGVLRCGSEQTLDRFLWQREAGFPVELLGAAEIAALSGGHAAPEVQHALYFPDDAVIDSRRLVAALRRSLELADVTILERTEVTEFRIERGVCRGVETADGPMLSERVVDAAGAWANFDPALPFPIPVEPVRGQMVELDAAQELPTVLESEEVYLVPRTGGSLLVGATVEHAGFRKEVTADGLGGLLAAAFSLSPSLRTARFLSAWAGLRPGTPDGLPLLGESPVAGLYLAAGHYRNGILLAPVTALLLADRLCGVSSRDLTPFSPERFVEAARAER